MKYIGDRLLEFKERRRSIIGIGLAAFPVAAFAWFFLFYVAMSNKHLLIDPKPFWYQIPQSTKDIILSLIWYGGAIVYVGNLWFRQRLLHLVNRHVAFGLRFTIGFFVFSLYMFLVLSIYVMTVFFYLSDIMATLGGLMLPVMAVLALLPRSVLERPFVGVPTAVEMAYGHVVGVSALQRGKQGLELVFLILVISVPLVGAIAHWTGDPIVGPSFDGLLPD